MDPTSLVLICGALIALGYSFFKDKEKTKKSLAIAKGSFLNIVGEIISILALIALFFIIVPEESIKSLMGGASPIMSAVYGALIGAVTIIPAFVAFPLSASLMDKGAHLIAVAAFITTLTMVGFATAPIEIEHFGKKFTLVRNLVSFLVAVLIAILMWVVL
ncbi:MAG: permease [Thermoplasmata archaeon]